MASADGATPGMGVLFNDSSDESDSDLEAPNKEKQRKDDDDAEDAEDDANDDGAEDQNKSDDEPTTTNETAPPTTNKDTESNEGDKDDGSGGDEDDDDGKGEKEEASPSDDGDEKGQDGGGTGEGGGGGRRIGDADDEEDDSDAEFDDKDANIVGKSAPPKPPPRPKSQHDDDDDDGYDDVNRQRDSTSSPGSGRRPARPPRKPRNMEVLDVSRPSTHRRGVTLHITKLPNVVGINPEAFDRNTYDADVEEREYSGFVHNMIRWRYKRDEESGDFLRDKNGKLTRESNARFVKWSDGSTTLHVGNETFEVDEIDAASNTSAKHSSSAINSGEKKFPGLNGYLYLSQKAMFRSNEDGEDGEGGGGEPEPGGTVLECMGSVSSKLVPRPSIKSEAHKNLTLAVRQKNMKRARIAEYVTQVDPEKEKSERIKNKDDLNRQEARGGGGRKTPSRNKYRPSPGMNRRYLEMDEDDRHYDSVNIGSLKRRNEMDDVMDYGEDSDSGEDDWSRRKKAGFQRGSRRPPQNEEDEEEAMFGEDSSDEENLKQARKKKRSHQAVVDEDDD